MDIVIYLSNKYTGNPFMQKKLEQYLENLPQVMQTIEEDHEKRARLKGESMERRDNFIHWFMTTHDYYYHPATEHFFKYSKNSFYHIPEDELLQTINRSIHMNLNMLKAKQTIKKKIMRSIKANPVLTAAISNETKTAIARSLNPHFLYDTTKTLYFLTCLGDILCGKRHLYFFMDVSFKPLVHAISQGLYSALNKHVSEYFKYKYYDHDYKKCRIIPGIWPENNLTKINYIDLAVVAAHYSEMYSSSDGYLNQCGDFHFEENALVLYNNTPTSLFETFLNEYTDKEHEKGTMSYKTMFYMWKFFLRKKTLPFVVSQQHFKRLVATSGMFDPATDTCNVGVKFPLYVVNFDMFWMTFMVADPKATYDLDEVVEVYNDWCDSKSMQITVEQCRAWVVRNYPGNLSGNLDREKIVGMNCKLWDKTIDIENAIEAEPMEKLTDMYDFYRAYTLTNSKRVASKEFFQQYIDSR